MTFLIKTPDHQIFYAGVCDVVQIPLFDPNIDRIEFEKLHPRNLLTVLNQCGGDQL